MTTLLKLQKTAEALYSVAPEEAETWCHAFTVGLEKILEQTQAKREAANEFVKAEDE